MVQASWTLIKAKKGGALKERYEYMMGKKGQGKKWTIIGVARRLAALLWTLTRNESDYETRKFAKPLSAGELVSEALAGKPVCRGLGVARGKTLKKAENSLDINHRSPMSCSPRRNRWTNRYSSG
jgi:hypothetical protein